MVFSHGSGSDRPDRCAAALDGGVEGGGLDVELTAGCRSVWLRTRFPGDTASIIFDQFDNAGHLDLSSAVESSVITGFVYEPGGLVSVPRTYIDVEIDAPITAARMHPHPERGSVLGSVTVDVARGRVATLAVGVSFIGVELTSSSRRRARSSLVRSP